MEHAGRPRLSSNRRRSWKQFFFSEWGLLLLAAVLSYIIWDNVRDKVLREYWIYDIGVELKVVPDGVAAVMEDGGTVDIKIYCSEREKDEIEAALKKDGSKRVQMLIRDAPTQDDRPLLAARDKFQWPFAEDRLLREVNPKQPRGTVFRVKLQTLTVTLPGHDLGTGADDGEQSRVEITVDPEIVSLPLPTAAQGEEKVLSPDTLPIRDLVEQQEFQFDTPKSLMLTWEGWRALPSGYRAVYRDRLQIPPVRAIVTVRQVSKQLITNTLLVQLDPNNYEYELTANRIKGVRTDGAEFSGMLKGRTSVLRELATETGKKNWYWVVRVDPSAELPEPPPEGKEAEWETLDASIDLAVFGPFRDRGIEFLPDPQQKAIALKVRWHPRHKN